MLGDAKLDNPVLDLSYREGDVRDLKPPPDLARGLLDASSQTSGQVRDELCSVAHADGFNAGAERIALGAGVDHQRLGGP